VTLGAFALAEVLSLPSASFRFCAGGRGGGGGGRRGGGGGRFGALREDAARLEVDGRGGCTIVVAVDMPAVETCEALLESMIECLT